MGPRTLHSLAGRFDASIGPLGLHERMIQFWGVMFDRRNELVALDCMNFSARVFPELVTPEELRALHPVETGYASPDAGPELGALIRAVELARLDRHSPHRAAVNRALVAAAGVGCGAGTTGAIRAVMSAITTLPPSAFPRANADAEVIVPLPNYPVCAAQPAGLPGLRPVFLHTRAENGFLPTFAEIAAAVTPRTTQISLTYPNNPAQATYEGPRLAELRAIVALCQAEGIFLLVDNVYQDLVFGRPFEELFALTERVDHLVKFYGPSKDTPFFAGHRIGYWFGDPRVQAAARAQAWLAENSANPNSMASFAVNLLLRLPALEGRTLVRADVEHLQAGSFGWEQRLDVDAVFRKLGQMGLPERFLDRRARADALQRQAGRAVRAQVRASPAFAEVIDEDVGNVCFVRVNPDVFAGDDVELFQLLCGAGYAVLPGSAFGMPLARGAAWFRITLIHLPVDTLCAHLAAVERVLLEAARPAGTGEPAARPMGSG